MEQAVFHGGHPQGKTSRTGTSTATAPLDMPISAVILHGSPYPIQWCRLHARIRRTQGGGWVNNSTRRRGTFVTGVDNHHDAVGTCKGIGYRDERAGRRNRGE